jgi:hypothetical protein
MKRAVLISATFLFLVFVARGWAVEPLVGSWQLDRQELNGQKKETEPLTLRITSEADKFLFAFSVPVNNIDFVSMTYTVKLDGSEADVKNARGEKVGTVQITAASPSHYKMVLKGENRPETTVHLKVSADKNTLISESDSALDGHAAHLVQSFSRH